ncbi:G-box-binding factor 4-like [Quillaja saponaria]|uniref:G-box-binding factor 4-like n=1 Tax=Quillaja saponaria TaxID=32244 RepID=A0AAD7M332_QUISA|nr:G-box-binding factor 4-like [Quillaja saponaria]
MASSKVVTTNTDLPRQSSVCPLSTIIPDLQPNHNSKTLGSVSMDDLLKSIYSEPSSNQTQLTPESNFNSGGGAGGASISRQGSLSLPEEMSIKTVDEVWKEIVEGSDQKRVGTGEGLEEMTLEDFLTKAGAVREEDVRGDPRLVVGPGNYGVDAAINGVGQFPIPAQGVEGSSILPFGNGIDGRVVGAPSATGRGKRRAVEEPLDKATQQKQKRMIKNRESAARSRERKQAYTVELESLVTHLEKENARLLREEFLRFKFWMQADENKERLKQLLENLIPVVEKRRPSRMLRRVHSMQWCG